MFEPGWKQKHYELLCRIDDVCRQYDINMYLRGDTALQAYRNEGLSDNVAVSINSRDVKIFIDAAEKSGLPLKGMYNHYRYKYFNLKAYDPNTIDFDITRADDDGCYGLFVSIDIMGNCTPKELETRRAGKLKVAFREYIHIKYDHMWAAPHRRLMLYNVAGKILPRDYFAKLIFNKLLNLYDHETEIVDIRGKKYPSEIFEKTRNVTIGDRQFKIPYDVNAYFTACFGIGWEDRKCTAYEEAREFRDSEHSWEEFKRYIDYLDLDKYYEINSNISETSEDYLEEHAKVRYNTNLMIRTHLRYILWQKYYPKKDELIRLREERNYEVLEEILHKYLLVIERTAKRQMTVCFDPEIFDIAMDVLRHNGHEQLAEAAEALVPPEHREIIRIKDYRGEYI